MFDNEEISVKILSTVPSRYLISRIISKDAQPWERY